MQVKKITSKIFALGFWNVESPAKNKEAIIDILKRVNLLNKFVGYNPTE